ncbi:hypothetical protein [Paraburkholderia solisilvae]|uniref:Uncharacterized protein n=1 Tax=Paraburkholderia solisilvae TaxID=624376 RepID=A0A6J5DIQ0_9BURK|nr:hypothetical protein [Paraburkholderia solisilvae]CAB3752756.1 hypothetical protein LMG29739_01578 [Paraburkholderia solisilvae]
MRRGSTDCKKERAPHGHPTPAALLPEQPGERGAVLRVSGLFFAMRTAVDYLGCADIDVAHRVRQVRPAYTV